MRDVELYRHLLGLESPWTVRSVELNVAEQRVDVWAHHPEGIRWPCPECGVELGLYDHTEERTWRHLDSCQFMTYLHAQPPRVECPTHGIRQVRLPWAEARARFTSLFERLAIDVLQETDIRGATRILRISWDEAWHILERAVERGQRAKGPRVTPHLGVDEKAIAKGHQYLTLVCDLDRATVEYIAEDRKQASLAGYFTSLAADQLAGIAAIALDMWEPYVQAIRAHVPEAESKIVYDRYHIMTHMGKAVDDVRKREHRALRAAGTTRSAARSTSGSTRRRICRSSIGSGSLSSRPPPSRPAAPGRSRRACASSGPTPGWAGPNAIGSAGTSGRPIRA